jgi:putative cardiolipin synthase
MPDRPPSSALTDTASTTLCRAIAPLASARPGLTGILALPNGREAFAARHRLSGAAERSIDVQYYIWRADTSGKLLAHALWLAAERGVRVRMLLDDGNTGGLDGVLAALDAHPNIEVRLFNPFVNRSSRMANFAGDFTRLNRRMHNKLWVVDNQVAVIGGRNIGDEYLGEEQAVEFADLDVVATGAVVADVSVSFDAYWRSASAFPVSAVLAPVAPGTAPVSAASWDTLAEDPKAIAYLDAVRSSVADPARLASGGVQEWAPASMLADDPAKVLHPDDRVDLHMLPRLLQKLSGAQRELVLVSPYFVPTRLGTDALTQIAARGVRVSVLTNSLASTDVTPAYAGYARYRKDLLRAGVRLFELKPTRMRQRHEDKDDKEARRTVGGSAGASLHAKTFAVDRERIFVGSFNLDPRSARLNTESGVILDSPVLASRLTDAFVDDIPQRAYEVRLDDSGNGLVWIERDGSTEVRHTSAPHSGPLRRGWSTFLGWLPIEWLL